MTPARYVNVDWVGTAERKGGARLVVRDQEGREASFPRPSTEQAVDALLAVLRSRRVKLVKVEVRSGLWIAAGARLHCRRWFLPQTIDVHVWLAVALAERLKVPLVVDDRVFRIESLIEDADAAAEAPADEGGFVQ